MSSVDSNFNFLCGRPHGAGPPSPVHMRPPQPDPPPCGRHKFSVWTSTWGWTPSLSSPCVHLSLTPLPPPCGRHKWSLSYPIFFPSCWHFDQRMKTRSGSHLINVELEVFRPLVTSELIDGSPKLFRTLCFVQLPQLSGIELLNETADLQGQCISLPISITAP